jgi:integrase
MAEVDLKHLHKVTSKGRTYFYAWRGGPRIKAAPNTPQFAAEYAAHHGSRHQADNKKVKGVVQLFKASDDWLKGCGDKTKASWSPWLDRVVTRFGDVPLRAFDLPQIKGPIKTWRDSFSSTPRAADMGIQVLSRVLSFSIANGWILNNACAGMEPLYDGDRSDIIWEEPELASIEAAAPKEVWWVVRLALLTGLRKSDLLKLTWSHVKPTHIQITTGKSKHRRSALVPMYEELEQFLATLPRHDGVLTVLTNTRGRPWGSGFNSSWNRTKTKAKVDKHFHDLRGNAATVMYRAGLTEEAIAECMAWSVDTVKAIIKKYVNLEKHMAERIAAINAMRTTREQKV